MELLLNLAWLLLALPAYWLWRVPRGTHAGRRFTSFQCLFALGCLLVILFPVVSATDDLRVMRAEMEESPVSKRSISQSSGEKPYTSRWQVQPAAVFASSFFVPVVQRWHQLLTPSFVLPTSPAVRRVGRAPPQLFCV